MIDAGRSEFGSRAMACRLSVNTRASDPVRGTLTNVVTAMITTMVLLASASAEAQTLVITRGGSRPVQPAPAANFTGGARVETLFEALAPSDASGAYVTFEPGARTAWHSHPRGQILIVTDGTGRAQSWGGPIQEIRAGDVVRIPAGQKHWHGASPRASMTHLAITEHRDGARVQWMEPVSDEQYNGAPSQAPGQDQGQSAQQASASTRPQGTTAKRPSGDVKPRIAPGRAPSRRSRSTIRCTPRGRSTPRPCAPWARACHLPPRTRRGPAR